MEDIQHMPLGVSDEACLASDHSPVYPSYSVYKTESTSPRGEDKNGALKGQARKTKSGTRLGKIYKRQLVPAVILWRLKRANPTVL